MPQEQFSEEWDFIPPGQPPRDKQIPPQRLHPKVAGHYGWKTNLFQVALVRPRLLLSPLQINPNPVPQPS
jgi:hypothetical protein